MKENISAHCHLYGAAYVSSIEFKQARKCELAKLTKLTKLITRTRQCVLQTPLKF